MNADASLLDPEHINRTRYRPGQRAGHYESFYQRGNHPTEPRAFWIRYTVFSPADMPEAAIGELWAIWFDGVTGQHVVAKEEQQVILFSMIAMFLFSALGGTWFPLETAGAAFATVGRLMPSAWAMTGLQNLLIRGLLLNSVLLPCAILLAYAAAFFGLAVWRFKFE